MADLEGFQCRRLAMITLNLTFKPINLEQHANLCREFIADTHLCSYGTLDDFSEDGKTPQHFLECIASEMDAFVTQHFQQRGYKTTRLSVTAFNGRAIRFYRKHGWIDLGPREDNPATHNMEKDTTY